MIRLAFLLLLTVSTVTAHAQRDTTEVLADEFIVTYDGNVAVDSIGVLVYADSTVGYYRAGSEDTLFVDEIVAVYMGKGVEAIIEQRELEVPTIWTQIVDGDIYVNIGRAIPIPLALTLAVGLPLGTLALLLYLARRLRQEKRQRRQLQEAGRQIAASREDERLRLARELHDGPLQDLHSLHMQLGLTAEALHRVEGAEVETRRVRGTLDDAHTVIGELRGIMEALRPPALGPFGLAAALRSHTERFRRRALGIEVDLDLDDDGLALPEAVRLVLFRVAQEAMNNAAKHAHPTRIQVVFKLTPSEAMLRVEDDGVGLAHPPDTRALSADGHFGFVGMQERARSVGGVLDVEGWAGQGTRVEARIPRHEESGSTR
ncbi:MAG: sensor histidine kinase [Bacteroidota bacterium]